MVNLITINHFNNIRIIFFMIYNPYFAIPIFITMTNTGNITWFDNTIFFNKFLYFRNR